MKKEIGGTTAIAAVGDTHGHLQLALCVLARRMRREALGAQPRDVHPARRAPRRSAWRMRAPRAVAYTLPPVGPQRS